MPSLVLLVSALYLKSFATWLKLHINDDGKKISKNSLKVSLQYDSTPSNDRRFIMSDIFQATKKLNIMVISSIVLSTHAVGVVTMSIANYLVKKLTWSSETSLLFSYISTSVLFAVIFAAAMKRYKKALPFESLNWREIQILLFFRYNANENWILLNVICLNELGTFLLCVSMHNFSFGFITALIYVLPSLWISATNNRYFLTQSIPFFITCITIVCVADGTKN